jgi:hypothetical protein
VNKEEFIPDPDHFFQVILDPDRTNTRPKKENSKFSVFILRMNRTLKAFYYDVLAFLIGSGPTTLEANLAYVNLRK